MNHCFDVRPLIEHEFWKKRNDAIGEELCKSIDETVKEIEEKEEKIRSRMLQKAFYWFNVGKLTVYFTIYPEFGYIKPEPPCWIGEIRISYITVQFKK